MTMNLTCELDETCRIDGVNAHKLLQGAVENRAGVRLLVPFDGVESAVSGRMKSADETTLTLELDRAAGGNIDWDHTAVHVTLEVDSATYFFETTMLRSRRESGGNTLVVYRPAVLERNERRHAVRKALREPAEVTLLPMSGRGPFVPAVMLNLGPGGLACRVDREAGAQLAVGQRVRAVFKVGAERYAFDLVCRISNVLSGARGSTSVVGLSLVDDENPPLTHSRLWAVLKSSE